MKVLITGNLGYVGAPLTKLLVKGNHSVIGYDSGFFLGCLTSDTRAPETALTTQIYGDIRRFDPTLLEGVDAVVHLSALSNDPMGQQFEALTEIINQECSVSLAKLAVRHGVKNFVFASSCSVYGAGNDSPRSEDDPLNPLTAYARSKIGTELALAKTDTGEMTVTCLRFATACGMSERLRLDLVLNDLVLNALLDRTVRVLSDGSPWRPLIDVSDMARAIDWATTRSVGNGGRFLVVNAGHDDWNYQVKDLATAVAAEIPGSAVSINKHAAPDKRSYRVNFARFRDLAPNALPVVDLRSSILRLRDGIDRMLSSGGRENLSRYKRLPELQRLVTGRQLSSDLFWTPAAQ
jgi:nucleoside-diphosphate-sugar epimerase